MNHRADPLPVVIDANFLAGALTRNIVLSLAEAGFFRPFWSRRILDELFDVSDYGTKEGIA